MVQQKGEDAGRSWNPFLKINNSLVPPPTGSAARINLVPLGELKFTLASRMPSKGLTAQLAR